jgi:hypothetical protein
MCLSSDGVWVCSQPQCQNSSQQTLIAEVETREHPAIEQDLKIETSFITTSLPSDGSEGQSSSPRDDFAFDKLHFLTLVASREAGEFEKEDEYIPEDAGTEYLKPSEEEKIGRRFGKSTEHERKLNAGSLV